jgi:hypothetical protein
MSFPRAADRDEPHHGRADLPTIDEPMLAGGLQPRDC